jgi:hypothetical protein
MAGFYAVFSLCAILFGVAILCGLLFIPNDGPPHYSCRMLKDTFNFEALKETVEVCTKSREGSRRL